MVARDGAGKRFPDGVDVAGEVVEGHLWMHGVTAEDTVELHQATVEGNAWLPRMTVRGAVYASGLTADGVAEAPGVMDLEDATVHGDAYLRGGAAAAVRAPELTVDGTLDLTGFDAEIYGLTDAMGGELRLGYADGTVDLRGAAFDACWLDGFDGYDLRVDEETQLGGLTVGHDRDPAPSLGRREEALLEELTGEGCAVTDAAGYLDDAGMRGAFGSLVRKGVVVEADGGYVARTDPLYR